MYCSANGLIQAFCIQSMAQQIAVCCRGMLSNVSLRDRIAEEKNLALLDNMVNGSKYTDNKEFMPIEGAVHTDLYDGGEKKVIPWDKLEAFFGSNLK